MNAHWLMVVVAAVFEVGWATGLKYADSTLTWGLTVIGIIGSFGLLIKSSTLLPASTVYAVFAGLGAVGTVLVDIIFFNANMNIWMIIFLVLLLAGIIGLKSVTGESSTGRDQS